MEEAARLVLEEEGQRQHTGEENETSGKIDASVEQLASHLGNIQLSTSVAKKTNLKGDLTPLNYNQAQTGEEETGLATVMLPSSVLPAPSDTNKPLIEELDNDHQLKLVETTGSSNDSSGSSSSSGGGSSSKLESSSSSSSEEDNASTNSSEMKHNSN